MKWSNNRRASTLQDSRPSPTLHVVKGSHTLADKPPFRRYRDLDGKIVLARQRSEAFQTTLQSGRLDQRKAGSQRAVDYRRVTMGRAGDYELIIDPNTGQHAAMGRKLFELTHTLDPSEEPPVT